MRISANIIVFLQHERYSILLWCDCTGTYYTGDVYLLLARGIDAQRGGPIKQRWNAVRYYYKKRGLICLLEAKLCGRQKIMFASNGRGSCSVF